MISLFDQELLAMEREVRDLKTIHQRGLGTTRFYTYERNIEITGDSIYEWFFQAVVEDTNLIPMVVLPFIEGPTTSNFSMNFTENGFVVGTLATQGTVTVRVVTSSALASIATWVQSW